MTNLTLAIDEEVLKQARIRALQQGTSVNALLREYLEEYVGIRNRRVQALEEMRAISERAGSGSGAATGPATSCMTSKTFVHTNVLVYLYDQDGRSARSKW